MIQFGVARTIHRISRALSTKTGLKRALNSIKKVHAMGSEAGLDRLDRKNPSTAHIVCYSTWCNT